MHMFTRFLNLLFKYCKLVLQVIAKLQTPKVELQIQSVKF
jgi:hypothetical protein